MVLLRVQSFRTVGVVLGTDIYLFTREDDSYCVNTNWSVEWSRDIATEVLGDVEITS